MIEVGTSESEDDVWIRESDEDYRVTLTCDARELVKYTKDEDCGNANHKTQSGKRFAHLHVNYVLPKNGKDEDDETRQVTLPKINGYWDVKFAASYEGEAEVERTIDANVKYNCIAYALGFLDAWIEPGEGAGALILSEDYVETVKYEEATIEMRQTHGIRIVESTVGKIKKTSEKNAQSGIYEATFAEGRTCDFGFGRKLYKPK